MKPTLENVAIEGNHSIKVVHYSCQAFQDNHGWHFHPEYELSLIVRGSGKRLLGDSIEQFRPGDVVLVGPNVPHCWISDDGETENEMMVLQFGEDLVRGPLLTIPEAKALPPLLSLANRGVFYAGETAQSLANGIREIEGKQGLARLASFIELLDGLSQAEVAQVLTGEDYAADNTQFNSGRLAKVMSFVKEHLSEDIKQSDVADHVCMTPQSFSRFFKATTGRTFVSFLNTLRVTEACRLLINTDADIVDVAVACGYANLSNFNRRFAEIKACTPSQYRKRHLVTPSPRS